MRLSKCSVCRQPFQKRSLMHRTCSPECAIEQVKLDKAKKARKEHKEAKAKARSRRDWLKLAEGVMNQYVRLRDSKLGCVSCDKPSTWQGQWHCSHFRSVGAASAIRYNLWNMHKSCSVCNKWLSGNVSEYEPRLRAKIGDEKVDWLKSQNQPVTYSIEYLQRLIKVFKKKIKRLSSRSSNS